jgi:hypothetical protein
MRRHQRDGGPADGNLPQELDAFVGRSVELADLARALDAARLVTVTGAGGVGKSRLAARAAAMRVPPDGVRRVELAPVRDPRFVDHAVAEALGLADHTARPPRETLLAHLAERQLLLLLDGFEHLVDACAELVGALLQALPEQMRDALTASRSKLNTQSTLDGMLDILVEAAPGAKPAAANVHALHADERRRA